MTTAREHDQASGEEALAARLTGEQVWRALTRASFAVVSYVTPAGEPRSSGVVYAADGRRLYVAVASDSWKARHIAASGRVAVTVPVRRGGLLSLLSPSRPPPSASTARRPSVRPARWRTARRQRGWRPCCHPSGELRAASSRSSPRAGSWSTGWACRWRGCAARQPPGRACRWDATARVSTPARRYEPGLQAGSSGTVAGESTCR